MKQAKDYLSKYSKLSHGWGLFHVLGTYAAWALLLVLSLSVIPWSPFTALTVYSILLTVILLRLENLAHEACHGLLSPSQHINYGLLLLTHMPIFIHFRDRRLNHLEHHQVFLAMKDENHPDLKSESAKERPFILALTPFAICLIAYGVLAIVAGWWSMLLFAGHLVSWCVCLFFRFFILGIQHDFSYKAPQSQFTATPVPGHFTHNYCFRSKLLNTLLLSYGGGWHLTHHLYPYVPGSKLEELSRDLELPAMRILGWDETNRILLQTSATIEASRSD